MSEMLFIQNTTTPSLILAGLDEHTTAQLCRTNNTSLGSYLQEGSIFSLDDDIVATNIRAYLNYLPAPQRQCIGNLAKTCGDETLVLAAFMDHYFNEANLLKLNSAIGAASTAAVARLDNFEKAVVNYQKALNNLRQLSASGHYGRGHAATIQQAKVRIGETYAELKVRYGLELQKFAPEALHGKNRGTAFSNAERGATLAARNANSPKTDVRLNVEGQLQASQLARMGKMINGLGNAAIAVDAGMRIVKVIGIEAEGGDWMREGAKQISGFGAGVAAGLIVGNGVYIGLLAVAGPVGWATLGAIFAASLAAGYLASGMGSTIGETASERAWELSR